MKRFLTTALSLTLATAAFAQDDQDALRKLIEESLPPEVGDAKVVEDLLRPNVGPQLSQNWALRNTFRAFADKLSPTEECFLETKPGGDPSVPVEDCTYVNGNRNGSEPASMMRFNLAEGRIKYLNRGRELDPNGEENKLTEGEAVENSLALAKMVGIPEQEIARQFVNASEVMATASSTDPKGADSISKRMEVFTTVPRCMPVDGSALSDCVPVFNSGLRIALADGPRGTQASWFNGVWPDFKLAAAEKVLSRTQVVDLTAEALAPQTDPASLQRLQVFIAYAQNRELQAQNNHAHCTSAEGDERDAEPGQPNQRPVQTPAHLSADRQFLPAIVVYAIPNELKEGQINPEEQTVSTGLPVISIPLVSADAAEC